MRAACTLVPQAAATASHVQSPIRPKTSDPPLHMPGATTTRRESELPSATRASRAVVLMSTLSYLPGRTGRGGSRSATSRATSASVAASNSS